MKITAIQYFKVNEIYVKIISEIVRKIFEKVKITLELKKFGESVEKSGNKLKLIFSRKKVLKLIIS
jgi:hypothetical protein